MKVLVNQIFFALETLKSHTFFKSYCTGGTLLLYPQYHLIVLGIQ